MKNNFTNCNNTCISQFFNVKFQHFCIFVYKKFLFVRGKMTNFRYRLKKNSYPWWRFFVFFKNIFFSKRTKNMFFVFFSFLNISFAVRSFREFFSHPWNWSLVCEMLCLAPNGPNSRVIPVPTGLSGKFLTYASADGFSRTNGRGYPKCAFLVLQNALKWVVIVDSRCPMLPGMQQV